MGENHKTPLFKNIYWKWLFRRKNPVAGTEIKVILKASTDMKLQKTNLRWATKGWRKVSALEQVIILFTPHCMKALVPSLSWNTSPSFIANSFCFCTWMTYSETTSYSESGFNIWFYNFTLID